MPQPPVAPLPAANVLSASEIVTLSSLVGVVVFAVLSAIALIRSRNRAEAEKLRMAAEIADLKAVADRAETLLNIDDQRLVVWDEPGAEAFVVGRLPRRGVIPGARGDFLAFGTWLTPESAGDLDRATSRLRDRGEAFALALTTRDGDMVETVGRTAGGRAVVRFRDLSGDRLALAALETRHGAMAGELDTLKAALDAAPMPVWLRDSEGALVWVNRAYATAADAGDVGLAVAGGRELLDSAAREQVRSAHASEPVVRKRLSAVSGGSRLFLDVIDVVTARGSGGVALDASEVEAAQSALKRLTDFHARTLDQLATPVAIFGADRRLRSYNAAYRALFGLDLVFLAGMPDEGAVIDRLRATRKLPEQADFRSWKASLLSAYQSLEAREQMWHLPDGQTLRVIANPHPQGGMTWIYENVTERLELESRYNALIRIQGETLDHLSEGVAVFGSDGRLRLHNPAFAAIWKLGEAGLAQRPHIGDIVAVCRRLNNDEDAWTALTASIAGVDEARASLAGRMVRPDGRAIDFSTVPLPDGQTMLTFADVTDSMRVELALTDRNEALEAADRLKNAFVQQMSYELRSPLTNIIGFSELIADAKIGPLNPRQREYIGYVMASSRTLHALVDDILDLATIDAGIMRLDRQEIEIRDVVDAALEALRDRVEESRLRVQTRIPADAGKIFADPKRMKQILFNLLSNAVAFSSDGGRVMVGVARRGDSIEFTVTDDGVGIPENILGTVFDRFVTHAGAAGHRGAGLGLAMAKSFVDLHGGTIAIASAEGKGTTVTVRLPARQADADAAE